MKSMIAILALLGVASAGIFDLFPSYNQEPINTPWFQKYGDTWPWTFPRPTYPYGQYHSYERNYGPEYFPEKYPIKETSIARRVSYPAFMDKIFEHEFYEKYLPKYEQLISQYEKFVYPKFEKFSPLWDKYETSEYYPKYFQQRPFNFGLF